MEQKNNQQGTIEKMAAAGLYFGHKTSKKHPKMEPYIYGTKNGVHIIDLNKTEEKIKEASDFIEKSVAENKKIVLIGTKVQIRKIVEETAIACGFSYVTNRWLGGTITNFESIKSRIDHLRDLRKKKEEGDLEKYTKKEQLMISREIESLEDKFGGLENLEETPDILIVLDMVGDITAVKEAKIKEIKIVGIIDTDTDPNLADYPIPANDDAISSIKYILDRIKEAAIKGKEKQIKEN